MTADVMHHPLDGGGDVFGARRPRVPRGQSVVHGDPDHAVAGGPTTDMVVIGEFLEAFVAPGVSPAMHEQQDRGSGSQCTVWQVNVQAVPRSGPYAMSRSIDYAW